jgi:catechol 2,3-dioxygenase-like lactoylglutathione lyase family enzyme
MTTNATLEPVTMGILAEAPVVSLILYVDNLSSSREFYERRLGLRVVDRDEDSVTYAAGGITLSLNVASRHGVKLAGRNDDGSDIVFMVDDFDTVRDALAHRGVEFMRRRTYDVGMVTDFYDPDGHRLMIYQPSEEALSWPSGQKLRDVWRAYGRGGADLIGPPLRVEGKAEARAAGLDGKPVAYLFMFVPDSTAAYAFYRATLGLHPMEMVSCCNPECPPDDKGIVKYDVGNLLLSTHHIHGTPVVDDYGTVYSPRSVDPAHVGAIVPVFEVDDVENAVARLTPLGVKFPGVKFSGNSMGSRPGSLARFSTATGHTFLLRKSNSGAPKWTGS